MFLSCLLPTSSPSDIVSWIDGLLGSRLAQALGALIGLYLVYWFGLRAFYRQKEYENVRFRYLDQGFDLASNQVEHALGVFRTNWSQFLRLIWKCREWEGPFDATEYLTNFRELDQDLFRVTPAHRISVLLETDVVWQILQQVFSFVQNRNTRMKTDFGSALMHFATNPEDPRKSELIEKAQKAAEEMSKDSKEYYVFLSELNRLGQIFEKQRLLQKSLPKFSKLDAVKMIVENLRTTFPQA